MTDRQYPRDVPESLPGHLAEPPPHPKVQEKDAKPARPSKSAKTGTSSKSSRVKGPSLLQRLLRRPPVLQDTLPHATFSNTSMGIRSVVKAGRGSPTVLFEAGVGSGKRIWAPVFNAVSEVTQAVAYDRAGYGQSEVAEGSRDGLQIVLELRAMLEAEGIAPPYVLVGHSLGGTIMKLFAKMYPQDVAGAVLVDARHEEFAQRCQQVGVSRLLYEPPEALMRMLTPIARAELSAARLTMKQARRAGNFPPVPLIVLTHGRAASRWPLGVGKVWAASQQKLAQMSKLGRLKVLDEASHNLHTEQPEIVTKAVLSVVRAARYVASKKTKPSEP